VKLLSDAGHGTAMFQKFPGFIDELVAWLKQVDG